MKLAGMIVASSLLCSSGEAQQTELQQLPPPAPFDGDLTYNWFDGRNVALSEEWAAVTSVTTGISGMEVYLYRRTPLGWMFRQRVSAEYLSQFGSALAIDGDTLIAGAPRWPETYLGQVHVYEWSGSKWNRTQVINADGLWDNDKPAFGKAVDLENDILVVAAPLVDHPVEDGGEVRIFERVAGTWQLVQRFPLWPIPDVDALGHHQHYGLGWSVAVSGDTLIAGASRNYGAVYVYERDSEGWFRAAILENPTPERWDGFGTAVDIEGDRILVGMPVHDNHPRPGRAYVYERDGTGTWVLAKEIRASDGFANGDFGDEFGSAVALADERVFVGARNSGSNGDQNGAVYVFERHGGIWNAVEDYQLIASDPPECGWGTDFGQLGEAVAAHGSFVLAGAPDSCHMGVRTGKAYLFAIELGEPVCEVQGPTTIGVTGSAQAEDQNLVLTMRDAPANARGLALLAPIPGSHPFGDDFLCLGAPVSRIGYVLTGSDGVCLYPLDFDSHWLDGFLPGTTWYFQFAHERQAGTGRLEVLTNAVSVTFQ